MSSEQKIIEKLMSHISNPPIVFINLENSKLSYNEEYIRLCVSFTETYESLNTFQKIKLALFG